MGFTPEQVALLDRNAQVVEVRRLFRVEFKTATYRLAEGNVPLTIAGEVWQPARDWISASPIDSGGPLDALPAFYRVSSLIPELRRAALHDKASWYGAPIQQLVQLLSDGVPVGPPVSLHRGWLADAPREEGHASEWLDLRAESILAKRNYTPLGEYTDRDQQRRHPGDNGCAFAPSLVGKIITGWLRA